MTTSIFDARLSRIPHPPVATFSASHIPHSRGVTLLDVLDRVIDKGVVVDGEVVLQVADIDLVDLSLKLVLTSTERMRGLGGVPARALTPEERKRQRAELEVFERKLQKTVRLLPTVIRAASPKKAEHGLAKLVLTLIDLLRKLMERQAMRRIAGGSLTEFEVERLGLTFKALEQKMEEMKAAFGIEDKELNCDLGPLGQLM